MSKQIAQTSRRSNFSGARPSKNRESILLEKIRNAKNIFGEFPVKYVKGYNHPFRFTLNRNYIHLIS